VIVPWSGEVDRDAAQEREEGDHGTGKYLA
jgi:hypothetical protein